jgi:hypothetical protein
MFSAVNSTTTGDDGGATDTGSIAGARAATAADGATAEEFDAGRRWGVRSPTAFSAPAPRTLSSPVMRERDAPLGTFRNLQGTPRSSSLQPPLPESDIRRAAERSKLARSSLDRAKRATISMTASASAMGAGDTL